MTALCLAESTTGDLALSANGRSISLASGTTAIALMAKQRLRLLTGEHVYDIDAGLRLSSILGPSISDAQVQAEVRRVLLQTPGVDRVREIRVTRTGRSATVRWVAVAGAETLVGVETLGG